MIDDPSVTFPDAPRGELDSAIDDLVVRAHEVLKIQGRLRSLLKANQAIIEHVELRVVLERTVAAAVELVGAEYGALAVIAPDGSFEQFIHAGMSERNVADIGQIQEGCGLLGPLIDDPRPIRLDRLSDDPRSAGLSTGHPSMDSFLAVPVIVRTRVYGNLYLGNQTSGKFSADDEQLVTALAVTAGVAVENARLFAETSRRQSWSAASAEFTAALLSGETGDAISTFAGRVLQLSDADVVWLLVPGATPTELTVETARGFDEETKQGSTVTIPTSIAARILEGAQPRRIDDGTELNLTLSDGRALGPALAVPLMTTARKQGVLLVARLHGGLRFATADLEMAADFAAQASIAMELAAARADRQRLVLLEDRGRIARDLHDHVIQQLFGTGLELRSIANGLPSGDTPTRILESIAHLDSSISQIRTVIFALSAQTDGAGNTVRHWIIDLANELAPALATTPTVSFSGPVDLVVTEELAADVIAVAREALVNIVKHADAAHSSVSLAVLESEILLKIEDDGHGAAQATRRSGVANLEERALRRGGVFHFDSDLDGTRLSWRVPYLVASP
jgi:signal transduction histidine kinase